MNILKCFLMQNLEFFDWNFYKSSAAEDLPNSRKTSEGFLLLFNIEVLLKNSCSLCLTSAATFKKVYF